jgi:hypothetical protein
MAQVEVIFAYGSLRQPGMWGKLIVPGGAIYDVPVAAAEQALQQQIRKIELPYYPDGGLLLFGIRGYLKGTGILSSSYVLLRIQDGAACDWQFPTLLVRVQGKSVQLLTQSVEDLAPIYAAVAEAGFDREQLRSMLRQQGMDQQPAGTEPSKG